MPVCLLAVIAAGCAYTGTTKFEPPAPLLQTAATTLLAGDNETAVTLYTDFLGTNPDSVRVAEAYLGRGNAYYGLGRYDLAGRDYSNAVVKSSDRAVSAQATMGLGNAAAAEERFTAAETVYRRVLRSYGGYVPRDETTYRLGLMLARQGKWDEGAGELGRVVSTWPLGEYGRYAKAKLEAVALRSFTVQVGAYANKMLAEKTVKDLAAKGLSGRIETIDTSDVPLFAARSGRFSTWPAAKLHAEKLESEGFPTYLLP